MKQKLPLIIFKITMVNIPHNNFNIPVPGDDCTINELCEYERKLIDKHEDLNKRKRDELYEEKNTHKKALVDLRECIYNKENAMGTQSLRDELTVILRTMNTTLTEIKTQMTELKIEVTAMGSNLKKLTNRQDVTENLQLNVAGYPLKPVTFINADGPVGTDLPSIETIRDIDSMSLDNIKAYLTGYDVAYTNNETTGLKRKLAYAIGFRSESNMNYRWTR